MSLKTLDPSQHAIIIAGAIMSGFADGTFITVARNVDTFTLVPGSDGVVTRVKTNNRSGRITLTLQRTSDSNAVLTALMLDDELGNSGVTPIIIKQGNVVEATAARAWIVKPPEDEMANDVTSRVWVFETDELLQNLQGVEND